MNKKTLIYFGMAFAILEGMAVWINIKNSNKDKITNSQNEPTVLNAQAIAKSNQKQKAETAVETLIGSMHNVGFRDVGPISRQIQAAIDSKDADKIIQAFHDAVYAPSSQMKETIPVLKSLLSNPDPWIRFQAAQDLYITGDNSGMAVLVDLLQAGHVIRDYEGDDLRTQAVEVLEKYREKNSIDALIGYVRLPGNTAGITGLAKIMRGSLPQDITQIVTSNNNPLIIYDVLLINPQKAKDLATATFEDPKVQKIYQQEAKIEAAWAMLLAGERDPYYSYLFDLANAEITESPGWNGYGHNPYEYSLKILASMKSPANAAMLERALNNKNMQIIEIALVNLYYNQGDILAVKGYLLNKFNGPTNELVNSDFLMQLAAAINDPQINTAAATVDQRTESSRWAYFEDRKNWSVYTWIDDYVVDLNGSMPVR